MRLRLIHAYTEEEQTHTPQSLDNYFGYGIISILILKYEIKRNPKKNW